MLSYSTKATIERLNGLVQACRDSAMGFTAAGAAVEAPELRTMFRELALERGQFAVELETEIMQLGEPPAAEATLLGAIHRGWLNLKSAIAGSDETAVLAECEQREEWVADAFREALKESALPEHSRTLIARQMSSVQVARERVREWELAHQSA